MALGGNANGNPIEINADKTILLSFAHTQHKMGSLLRAGYINKFLKDRITFKSNLITVAQ